MAILARLDFLEALKRAEPALGAATAVPQFARFWFDGNYVTAFNDDLGVRVDLKTGFKGGVNGDTLIELLKASKAPQVDITKEGNKLHLNMGRARPSLAANDLDEAVWSMPEPSGETLPVDSDKLIEGVRHCMRSIGSIPSIPESMGVTFTAEKKELVLYSTKNTAMSKAVIPLTKNPAFSRCTVHKKFCHVMLKLAERKIKFRLELTDEHALLVSDGLLVYGRLMHTSKPINFEMGLSQAARGKLVHAPIPEKLKQMLKRSMIISHNSRVSLIVKEGNKGQILRLHAKSSMGEMHDSTAIDHPNIDVWVIPEDIETGCDLKTIAITENGVVMKDENKTYVVGTMGE